MKLSDVIKFREKEIERLRGRAEFYLSSIPKESLIAVLLSGSVARGDFSPGKLGGMTDLTVFKIPTESITAAELFGENEDTDSPYHRVKRNGDWFQIWFTEMLDPESYRRLPEARKFALQESIVLWQKNNAYTDADQVFSEITAKDLIVSYHARLNGIKYLLSEYKVDRWERRQEPGQLHFNLNAAIDLAIGCLYNMNGKYTPASDRMMYYSYELEKKPEKYGTLLRRLMNQRSSSLMNYKRRERLFKTHFLEFLDESSPSI